MCESRDVCTRHTDMSGETQILKASDFTSCESKNFIPTFSTVWYYMQKRKEGGEELVPHLQDGLILYCIFFSFVRIQINPTMSDRQRTVLYLQNEFSLDNYLGKP